MKKYLLVLLSFLTSAGCLSAQITSPHSDILGAHMNYGRGCTACHTAHNGASGNGNAKGDDSFSGTTILWGQDATGLYGKTITTGGGKYVEVLPTSMSATSPDVNGMLTCLTCHDGNFASGAMMKNRLFESLPSTYRSVNSIPTLLGSSGGSSGIYLNQHPVGLNAKLSCGGSKWDCSIGANGAIQMTGAHSKQFVMHYGFFVLPGNYNNSPVMMCDTCHDPHSMNVFTVTKGSQSGLPPGNYATMFFLRGPYNPADPNTQSNQTAQFCRQCHADKSNEMNGGNAGTVF
jgi:formate-dependent nitrite reductase cytochrome c552 subunit